MAKWLLILALVVGCDTGHIYKVTDDKGGTQVVKTHAFVSSDEGLWLQHDSQADNGPVIPGRKWTIERLN